MGLARQNDGGCHVQEDVAIFIHRSAVKFKLTFCLDAENKARKEKSILVDVGSDDEGKVPHLRARGAYELLSFDLEERRERVDRDATPERDEEQEADVVAVDPVEKGVKLVRRCEGDGESDRERRLHAHLGRDQLERADTLAPVEETQVVDRVEHGSEHAEEVALRGDASRVGVLREECHARKRQANGCPNTRGDRHAGRPLRRWHDQRRQLDQKGAVARRCEREAV
mmetsp:Transcript_2248/g.4702  ORF Transcript_2248/g.4702 Transcript_2248/m.4702 type:complete len:227 (-) Transcript_2248:892-1572(-)